MPRHFVFYGASLALALLIIAPGAARAMGGLNPAPATAADPDYMAGKAAIAGQNWKAAITDFSKAAARSPKDADIQNYLGYAYRNEGNYAEAFAHYDVALKLNPNHLGAHEYLGEAYLLKGDLAHAEAQLYILDHLCTVGCPEYSALKAKVAAYKRAHPTG